MQGVARGFASSCGWDVAAQNCVERPEVYRFSRSNYATQKKCRGTQSSLRQEKGKLQTNKLSSLDELKLGAFDVRGEGVEPSTNWLKANCSTTELPAQIPFEGPSM